MDNRSWLNNAITVLALLGWITVVVVAWFVVKEKLGL